VEEHVISKVFLDSFLETLTEQDRRLLDLRQQGYTWKEIAAELYLAEGTVRNQISKILESWS
jgi:two-component system response regulator DesR